MYIHMCMFSWTLWIQICDFVLFDLGSAMIADPSNDTFMEFDEEDDVVLSCTARGIPRPNITWTPGPDSTRSVTTFESTDSEGFDVISSNITIMNIQRSDTLYTCSASNTLGSQIRSFTLTVNCK